MEPLVPNSVASEVAHAAERAAEKHVQELRSAPTRLNLVIEVYRTVSIYGAIEIMTKSRVDEIELRKCKFGVQSVRVVLPQRTYVR